MTQTSFFPHSKKLQSLSKESLSVFLWRWTMKIMEKQYQTTLVLQEMLHRSLLIPEMMMAGSSYWKMN
nr:hypothetical protein Iba_chr01bCG14220 [Ipomoea batatas]